jgi:hypothetical protein
MSLLRSHVQVSAAADDYDDIEYGAELLYDSLKDMLPKQYAWQGSNTGATRTALRLAIDHCERLPESPKKEAFIRDGRKLLKMRLHIGVTK